MLTTKTGDDPRWLVKVTTNSSTWRDILCKDTSAFTAHLKGNLSCDPGIQKFSVFMGYFDFQST